MLKDALEISLFVPNITKEEIVALRSAFDQDAVVYKGPETNNKVHFIFNDDSEINSGNFSPNRIAQGYSVIKGRAFTFELPSSGQGEHLWAQAFRDGTLIKRRAGDDPNSTLDVRKKK